MQCADCTTKVPMKTVARANIPSARPSTSARVARVRIGGGRHDAASLADAGGQTSFAPGASSAATQIGKSGLAFYDDVVRRVRATIEADFDVPRLYNAGSSRSLRLPAA